MPRNTPKTWMPNTILTAVDMNEQVRDNLKALGDPWTPYTPALNGSSSAGSVLGWYQATGKAIRFNIAVTFGGTVAPGSGNITLGLPVPMARGALPRFPVGLAVVCDISANSYTGRTAIRAGSDTIALMDQSGALVTWGFFGWAAGDTIFVEGAYEAA